MKRKIVVVVVLALALVLPLMSANASDDIWDILLEAARAVDKYNESQSKNTTSSSYTSFCDTINWPNTEGECGVAAFKIKGGSVGLGNFLESNNSYTPRAKGYIKRVLSNGNYEFYINSLYPKGYDISGYRVGSTVSIEFLYPCVSESEIEKIYKKCVPH